MKYRSLQKIQHIHNYAILHQKVVTSLLGGYIVEVITYARRSDAQCVVVRSTTLRGKINIYFRCCSILCTVVRSM